MPSFDFSVDTVTLFARALTVVVILVVTVVGLAILRRVLRRLIVAQIPKIREEKEDQLARRSETVAGAVTQTVSFVVWIVALLTILSELGVNIAPVLATVGVAGLAVGFASQNLIRDYLHGFFILMEDWYRVGEVAIVAGIGGLVVDINLRRTVLRDLDGVMHIIPNNKIELVSNVTRDWARINLNVAVAYGEDLDRVIQIMTEVGAQLKEDPVFGPDLISAPRVEGVDKLGESGIEIKVLAETKAMTHWGLTRELRKRLKARFDLEGIEIPWPHAKVYFGNSSGSTHQAEAGLDSQTTL